MTKQEIQDLINKKIAGQGSAVDVGGALPEILNGILELVQAAEPKIYELPPHVDDDVPIDDEIAGEIILQTTVKWGHTVFSENCLVTHDMVKDHIVAQGVCKVFVNEIVVNSDGEPDPFFAIVLCKSTDDDFYLYTIQI